MKKQKQLPSWDDGRVVANMNVPGMPWYDKTAKNTKTAKNKEERRDDISENKNNISEKLTRRETADIMLGGIGAALLVGLILCAGIVLFVFLCVMFL